MDKPKVADVVADPVPEADDEDFWVPGAVESTDFEGNRVGRATWVPRCEVEDIPDFVWRRIPEPTGWRILVQEWAPPKKSRGGVLFADVSDEYHNAGNYIGRVLAMGPACYRHPKFSIIGDDGERVLQEPWCEPGEWITFAQYTGTPRIIKHDGVMWRFRYVFDDNVEGGAPTPNGLKVYAA